LAQGNTQPFDAYGYLKGNTTQNFAPSGDLRNLPGQVADWANNIITGIGNAVNGAFNPVTDYMHAVAYSNANPSVTIDQAQQLIYMQRQMGAGQAQQGQAQGGQSGQKTPNVPGGQGIAGAGGQNQGVRNTKGQTADAARYTGMANAAQTGSNTPSASGNDAAVAYNDQRNQYFRDNPTQALLASYGYGGDNQGDINPNGNVGSVSQWTLTHDWRYRRKKKSVQLSEASGNAIGFNNLTSGTFDWRL
jgi:hypothetical protein